MGRTLAMGYNPTIQGNQKVRKKSPDDTEVVPPSYGSFRFLVLRSSLPVFGGMRSVASALRRFLHTFRQTGAALDRRHHERPADRHDELREPPGPKSALFFGPTATKKTPRHKS